MNFVPKTYLLKITGGKPKLQEIGPFVYKSKTMKDSDNNVNWWGDGTLTYRPRKLYNFEPALSSKEFDPDTVKLVVPNIPFWTGMNKLRKKGYPGLGVTPVVDATTGPFVTVTFSGLLWGYHEELPCLQFDPPAECAKGDSPFETGDGK